MDDLRKLLKGGKDYEEEARKITKPLEKEFPLVAQILGGMPATKTDDAVSPGTITIFIYEGKARFSANVKSQEKTFIGDLEDITNPWGSINTAFLLGGISAKRYADRVSSLPKPGDMEKLY